MSASNGKKSTWTFLTNHARVLMLIAADTHIRVRDLAAEIGITERAAQRIITELEEGGYLSRERVGRRNRYEIDYHAHLRHELERDIELGTMIGILERSRS
jgi:DNA-binding MarR family transcriptional regulator